MIKHGTEQVRGTIIGGDHLTGKLYYEGRPQSGNLYGRNDDELRNEATKAKQGWRDQCGDAFNTIYPNDSWELRIFE